jgi:hypothetical protein
LPLDSPQEICRQGFLSIVEGRHARAVDERDDPLKVRDILSRKSAVMTSGLLMLLLMWGRAAIVQAVDAWLIWYQFGAHHDNQIYPWEIYDAQDNRASCVVDCHN